MPTTTIDDATLLQVAGDRAEPLLPVLDRAQSLRPLVGVLAIVPCLLALERRGLDDAGAVWALQAVGAFGVETAAGSATALQMSWQPPLGPWLIRLTLLLTPLPSMVAPLMVSILATIGCLWCGFRLFAGVDRERLGFWTVLCLAAQGGLMLLATSAAPTVLVLFLTLLVFDCWQRHINNSDATVSASLLSAGIALGLVVLSGGAVVFALLAVLIGQQAIVEFLPGRKARDAKKRRVRAAVSFGLTVLTAFAVAGWWVMRSAAVGGADFWTVWWDGYDGTILLAIDGRFFSTAAESVKNAERFALILGPVLPAAGYGFLRLIQQSWSSRNDGERDPAQARVRALLLAWFCVAIALACFSPIERLPARPYLRLAESFLIIPICTCAAVTVQSILRRKTSFAAALALVGCSAVFLTWTLTTASIAGESAATRWVPLMATAAAVLVGGFALFRWARDLERRRRVTLLALLTGQLAIVAFAGVVQLRPQRVAERRLDGFRAELAALTPVDRAIFVSDGKPRPRLEFAMRSLFSKSQWHRVKNWPAATAILDGSSSEAGVTLLIDWTSLRNQIATVELADAELKQAAKPRFYRGRELRAFLLERK